MFKVIIFVFFLSYANSYKILGLFPFPGKSHYAVFDPLMVELAKRGHNVTVYNTFPKSYTIENYREIDLSKCFLLPNEGGIEQMKNMASTRFKAVHLLFEFTPSYEEITNCKHVLDLWNSTEDYDVLITEAFNTDVFFLYGEKLNIPMIAFHTNVPLPWHAEQMGMPNNPSYLPIQWSGYLPNMDFFERMNNFLLYSYGLFMYEYECRGKFDEIAPKIFGGSVSKMKDIASKVDLMLVYTHFSYNFPKPVVPNVIDVGGLNIKSSKSLPGVSSMFSYGSICCILWNELN